MVTWRKGIRTTIAVVVVTGATYASAAFAADEETVQRLVRELESMKRRLEKVEKETQAQREIIRRQAATIERLGGRSAGAAPARPGAPEPARTAAASPPPPPAVETPPTPPAKPTEPWSPTQPITLLSGSRGYLNISFDSLIDFGWSTTSDVPRIERGDHDPKQRGFTLPNEEIVFEGAVDPYFKGFADIVFKLDEENETEVELEEVYLMTTSLPWNLQSKGGQFFTEFGRINQQHPHAWDFVDQPVVIGRMLGPEGLRNPGARLSWLVPTPFYSELFVAMQDSQGGTAFSFRNPEHEFFGRPPVERSVTSLGDMLYVPRYVASFDLTDSQTLVAGVSGAFGPNDSGSDTSTQIYGGDLYWKWKPGWQSGGFPFVALQGEALGRRYEIGPVGGPTPLPSDTVYDWGFYSQLLYGFTQRWVAGMRVDWVSSASAPSVPVEDRIPARFRWSPNLTFYPTEFSKLRLQYNYDQGRGVPHGDASSVWMQVEFLLGSHAAHKF
jgi:hypothetical protein